MTQYKMNLTQFNLRVYLITHKIYENTKKGNQKNIVER